MLEERWRITLCGGLTARQGTHVITRFRTQKTGLLLAYLALHGERTHGREELAELFWEDNDLPLQSLRMALTSLRRQLELPGVGQGQVLAADRGYVRLASGAVTTDIAVFHAALAEAERTDAARLKAERLRAGVEAIGGELLPGCYEDWVLQAREVVAEQVQAALKELIALLMTLGEAEQALIYALRRTHHDALNEEAHTAVMELLLRLKRPADAVQHFQRLTTLLEELGVAPCSQAQELAAAAKSELKSAIPSSKLERVPAPPVSSSSTTRCAVPVVRLPLPLTPFFGRKEELQRLYAMLQPSTAGDTHEIDVRPWLPVWKSRVVTLLGTGGTGKTRLAIEAARRCGVEGDRSIYFVGLTDAETPERALQAVAQAVCPNAPVESAPLDVIMSALSAAPALLVLDNMEQLGEAGAEVAQTLLEKMPYLTLLVTSRSRLHLDGERELALLPLQTPESVDTPACLLEFASVQLFVDRAQAACADFQLTARNAASVAALCRRLEGLPLALELAASWAQTLSPAQMLARLNRRFDLLRARRKGVATRHQALETCIEWSFRLLRADVQPFFCRLCLFRGEWTLEIAEMLTADGQALDKIQQLREASFLFAREVPDPAGTVQHFRILESLREFGLERLAPEDIDNWQMRLAQTLIELPHPNPLLRIDAENIRDLAQWCRTSAAEPGLELELLNALKSFWLVRGGWIEGRGWLQDALRRHTAEDAPAYRVAWNTLGSLHWLLRETAHAKRCFNQALSLSKQAGDDALAARALNNLAMTATQEGDLVLACALGEQSLHFAQKLEDQVLVAALLNNVGSAHMSLENYETARIYLEQSLLANREQGVPKVAGMSLVNLGEIAHRLGDRNTARQMYEEGLEMLRAGEDQASIVETMHSLAQVLEEQGEIAQARLLREESAALRQRMEGEEKQ